uniref:IRT1 n=1 Tax=Sulla carnosa TaxID=299720 RepID=A0A386IRK4_9FABA|nr:IRT1 [Sulla carnosa]
MASSSVTPVLMKKIPIVFIFLTLFTSQALADCVSESTNSCNNKEKAETLKIIAIFSILVTSMIGVCLPLFTRSIPALSPESDLFIIVKCFAAGIILGMWSDCLDEKPWHEFPFSGLVAMFSAIVTMMVDSLATSFYSQKGKSKNSNEVIPENHEGGEHEMGVVVNVGHSHGHSHGHHHLHHGVKPENAESQQLLRYRVVAMVLELGIVVHSVVIGLSMGASNNTCSIRGLVAAMCFHQMFEGMGLGGCILQAEYNMLKKSIFVFLFSITTPLGIAIGMGMSTSYKENSPTALITVGLLNASSAGLLIYMALVDLLAADFMSPRLQGSIKLQLKAYLAVFLGAGGMSLMARWA